MDLLVIMLTIKSLYDQLARLYTWYRKTRDEEEQNRYCQDMEDVLEKIVAEWHRLSNPHVFYDEVLLLQYLSMTGDVTHDLLYGLERFRRGGAGTTCATKYRISRWLHG